MVRLAGIAAALIILGLAFAARAQPAAQVQRVGYLSGGFGSSVPAALIDGLRELGHVEGRNLMFEQRFASGDTKRLEQMAAELVSLKVDLIVALATPEVQAAQKASRTTPIVFAAVVDPVGARLVRSLGRPGGNTTGVSLLSAELGAKRLELLRELVPDLARVAVLLNPGNASNALQLRELESAARTSHVQLHSLEMRLPRDAEPAFRGAMQAGAGALVVLDDPVIGGQRARLAELSLSHGLPAVSGIGALADAGLLLTYGPSFAHQFRRAAVYASKILRGTRPADLPVEQPTEFELVVNMKTARALGVTVPRSVLLRASRIIE